MLKTTTTVHWLSAPSSTFGINLNKHEALQILCAVFSLSVKQEFQAGLRKLAF